MSTAIFSSLRSANITQRVEARESIFSQMEKKISNADVRNAN